MSAKGKLLITIVEGKNMPTMDWIGSSDVFVQAKVASNKVKTKVIKRCLQPIWNEKFLIGYQNSSDEVEFSVYGLFFKFLNFSFRLGSFEFK
jgi:Ca2+-dependent lipid-binding protein